MNTYTKHIMFDGVDDKAKIALIKEIQKINYNVFGKCGICFTDECSYFRTENDFTHFAIIDILANYYLFDFDSVSYEELEKLYFAAKNKKWSIGVSEIIHLQEIPF